MTKHFARLTIFLLFAIFWLSAASATFAAESTIVVDSLGDGDTGCTLRKAVKAANQNRPISPCPAGIAGHDTITFASNLTNKTIALQNGQIYISEDVTIDGDVRIDASHRSRIFAIDRDLSVTLQNMSFIRGFARNERETSFFQGGGGAIVARGSRLKIVDVTFSNNRAEVSGGAIAIDDRVGFLTVVGGEFYRNSADVDGGAIMLASGGTIHHSRFVGNHAVSQGGAVAALTTDSVNIQDASFERNIGLVGGGAVAGQGNLTILRVRFLANQTRNNGAHISHAFGTLTVSDSQLRYGNRLGSSFISGGGIFATHSDVIITDSDIIGNRVNGKGGGLYIGQGSLTMRDSKLQNNSSEESGGGAYMLETRVNISGSIVNDNRAADSGGGLLIDSRERSTNISSTVFRNNHARDFYGGGMLIMDGDVWLDHNEFFDNSARSGGALLLGGTDTATLTNVRIANNYARERGGGIAHHGGKLIIRDSTIYDNRAQYQGGGLYQDGLRAEVTRTYVTRNEATGCLRAPCNREWADGIGGGIYNHSSLDINDSFIDGNRGAVGGGGIANMTRHATAALVVHRTTIANNISPRGAGLYNSRGPNSTNETGSGAFLYNSTFSNNRAPEDYPINDGGAILNSEFVVLYFTTVYNNGGNGINSATGRVLLDHTIVAGSEFKNCVGNIFPDTVGKATEPNLDDDGSCGVSHTADPQLGVLTSNGGFAPTHMPQSSSPIYDMGRGDCRSGAFTHDQRWAMRSGTCGLGAVFGR